MSFKRPLSIPPPPEQVRSNKSSSLSKSGVCQVCGDKAFIINYGALSCQSCKTFFRRNGFKPESVHPCLSDRKCEVNIRTRKNCTACRLAKCFSIGMNSKLIRKEEKQNKKSPSKFKFNTTKDAVSKTLTSTPFLPKGNQLHHDLSLSSTERKLISNIVHAHDIFSKLPQVCQAIESLSLLPNKIQFDEKTAFEIVSLMYTSMQSFIRSSPDFQILTASEQYSLFERNFHAITILYSVPVLQDAVIINKPRFIDIFTIAYGSEILLPVKNLNKQLDLDSTILKLVLIVLAFSSNCFIVDLYENMFNDSLLYGTHRLLGSQNVYIELLWKYMIHHHDYNNSVLRFSRLIQLFLSLIKYSAIAYMNNTTHHELVNNILEKTKQLLMSEHNEQVQLWGKASHVHESDRI